MSEARMAGRGERPGVLLTGVGKRYDVVSAVARLTHTAAADPNPLAPAQYAADVCVQVPLIEDPDHVPTLGELVDRHGIGAVSGGGARRVVESAPTRSIIAHLGLHVSPNRPMIGVGRALMRYLRR